MIFFPTFVFLLHLLGKMSHGSITKEPSIINDDVQYCSFTVVESIPHGIVYNTDYTPHPTTYETWKDIISNAQESIDIASYYWDLRSETVAEELSIEGYEIFEDLVTAGSERNVKIQIVEDTSSEASSYPNTRALSEIAAVDVEGLNVTHCLGNGILHTKMMIVDNNILFIGSPNYDWKALTQKREVSVLVRNCSRLVNDGMKIFKTYRYQVQKDTCPPAEWPQELSTTYNLDDPMNVIINGNTAQVFLTSAPLPLCPYGRTYDLTAILNMINEAEEYCYVSVQDVFPLYLYTSEIMYWPDIDNALREAAINRGVVVRLLVNYDNSTADIADHFLKSLAQVSQSYSWVTIEVKQFFIKGIKNALHNKYMVTDKAVWIGTSNFCGDYFDFTNGAGIVIKEEIRDSETIRSQIREIFLRDFNSDYSTSVKTYV